MADTSKDRKTAKVDKPELNVPSTAALDMERRLADDNAPTTGLLTVNPAGAQEAAEEGYVGTDPIYQNHANDTEAPLAAEEGVWADAEDKYHEDLAGDAKEPSDELKAFYKDRSTNLDPDAKDDEAPKAEPKPTDTNSDEALEAKRAENLVNADEASTKKRSASSSGTSAGSGSGSSSS